MKLRNLFLIISIINSGAVFAQSKTNTQVLPSKSIDANKQSAEFDNADNYINMGLKKLEEKDYPAAIKLFNDAYNANKPDGAFYLARMLELGVGMQSEPDRARLLYLAASEKGSAKALNRVGLMTFRGEGVLQDYKSARDMICKSADMGDGDAAFNCAGLWQQGQGGIKDNTKAKFYYEKSAKQGHIGSINAIALAARDGETEVKDLKKAFTYFEQSAKKGNPLGLYELGSMYEAGLPVERDLVKAHMYFNLSSARQHPQASDALQRLSSIMSNDDIEKSQALARLWKAEP